MNQLYISTRLRWILLLLITSISFNSMHSQSFTENFDTNSGVSTSISSIYLENSLILYLNLLAMVEIWRGSRNMEKETLLL